MLSPLCCLLIRSLLAKVWSERPFIERNEYGLMGQAIKGIEKLYEDASFSDGCAKSALDVVISRPLLSTCRVFSFPKRLRFTRNACGGNRFPETSLIPTLILSASHVVHLGA